MFRHTLVAALAATSTALSVMRQEASQELFTIELAPGETQIVTEEQKWALKKEGKSFIDITNHPSLASSATDSVKAAAVTYPNAAYFGETVNYLFGLLSTDNLEKTLTTFSEFYTRYYTSDTGKQASDWVLQQVQAAIDASDAKGVTVKAFDHSWLQDSVIATIPGQGTNKIIVGAHLDSVNQDDETGRSPGADDDGSGSMTILEAFRVLLAAPDVAGGAGPNTLEFHWYSGEEGGLLGSADIYDKYKADGEVVKAMLQQDMTGYGDKPLGVITDHTDSGLTDYLRMIISQYTEIGSVDSECGYGCSDHASATAAGYPSAFVIESAMNETSPYIHTADDTLETVSYDHMLQHARMVVGYAYELYMWPQL